MFPILENFSSFWGARVDLSNELNISKIGKIFRKIFRMALSPSKNYVSTCFTLWAPRTACTVSGHVVPGHFHANPIRHLEIKPRRGELLGGTSTRSSTKS